MPVRRGSQTSGGPVEHGSQITQLQGWAIHREPALHWSFDCCVVRNRAERKQGTKCCTIAFTTLFDRDHIDRIDRTAERFADKTRNGRT